MQIPRNIPKNNFIRLSQRGSVCVQVISIVAKHSQDDYSHCGDVLLHLLWNFSFPFPAA